MGSNSIEGMINEREWEGRELGKGWDEKNRKCAETEMAAGSLSEVGIG